MELVVDENNFISLESEYSVYNPNLPMKLKFPGPEFCGDNDDQLLVVGTIPVESEELPEIIFAADGINEAFHLQIDTDGEVVRRWGVALNQTTPEQGILGEGTTIDKDEPFILRYIQYTLLIS